MDFKTGQYIVATKAIGENKPFSLGDPAMIITAGAHGVTVEWGEGNEFMQHIPNSELKAREFVKVKKVITWEREE